MTGVACGDVAKEVVIYNSFAMNLAWQAKYRLWLLPSDDEEKGHVMVGTRLFSIKRMAWIVGPLLMTF